MKPCSARAATLPADRGKPLKGKRVVITRPLDQAPELADRLAALGAEIIHLPSIEIGPPKSLESLDSAIRSVDSYDWIVFTSLNGVKYFFERYDLHQKSPAPPAPLRRAKIAAIGPATARSLQARGVVPDFIPKAFLSDEIAKGLTRVKGKRILLPRADIAPDTLPAALRKKGAVVDAVPVYRTVGASRASFDLLKEPVDLVTFTSSSTVAHFMGAYSVMPAGALVACIGPKTAATAREHGLPVHILAKEHTVPGLVQAIVSHYQSREVAAHAR
ncbi:MAG: uroporphyrinogen-III synthase [bacterium]